MNRLLLLACVWGLAACPKSMPAEQVTHDAATQVAQAPVVSVPTPAAATAARATCATHADCQVWASYCEEAPCVCFAVPTGTTPVACKTGKVACFVDPCLKKQAFCENGACTLSSAAATQ